MASVMASVDADETQEEGDKGRRQSKRHRKATKETTKEATKEATRKREKRREALRKRGIPGEPEETAEAAVSLARKFTIWPKRVDQEIADGWREDQPTRCEGAGEANKSDFIPCAHAAR